MTDYAAYLVELTEWAATKEFLAIAATHDELGGDSSAALEVAKAAAPAMRVRLAGIVDEKIAPLLRASEAAEEQGKRSFGGRRARHEDVLMLRSGMVLFTHEAEDYLANKLRSWLSEGAPRVVA
jgi:hypothetical protein